MVTDDKWYTPDAVTEALNQMGWGMLVENPPLPRTLKDQDCPGWDGGWKRTGVNLQSVTNFCVWLMMIGAIVVILMVMVSAP